jgi:hypothetical protein
MVVQAVSLTPLCLAAQAAGRLGRAVALAVVRPLEMTILAQVEQVHTTAVNIPQVIMMASQVMEVRVLVYLAVAARLEVHKMAQTPGLAVCTAVVLVATIKVVEANLRLAQVAQLESCGQEATDHFQTLPEMYKY